jgi:hypothetical protein
MTSKYFSDPKGDIFIEATAGAGASRFTFQASSDVLSRSSGPLATMLTLPQPNSGMVEGKALERPILLPDCEPAVFNVILQVLYNNLPSLLSLDVVLLSKCLRFADKFDMSMVLVLLRTYLFIPFFLMLPL